jgi:hypothetical protein
VLTLYLLILCSPFAIACAIAGSTRASTFVARHYWPCIVVGWTAVALLVPVAVMLDGPHRLKALAFVCPLIALSFWRRDSDEGGGEGDEPEPPQPDLPEIDWERFRRDLDEWSREGRPSSPVSNPPALVRR